MRLSYAGALLIVSACVPNGPPTSRSDAGVASALGSARRPSIPATAPSTMTGAGQRSDAASPTANRPTPSLPLGAGFQDDFERATLGPDWITTGADWRIENGRLCVKGAHNHGAWLQRVLPTNARIEFDAVSLSADGDIKAEIFGDGRSAASGNSYNDATSYLTIFGGWKNNFHVLARLNEHASDRPEIRIAPGSDDERARPVTAGQSYHFKVERADGKTVSWWVGDLLMFKFTDPAPLSGEGHDHLGFNDWEVPVCFDNVKVAPL
jgi:hypothetical protein